MWMESSPMPAADPTRIGRYRVRDRLGQGGMGLVFAAYDPELDRRVAIKLMYAEASERRMQRSRDLLRREAQALARLAHPNIVAIHDVGVHDGQVFVAMEYVDGRTMRQWWAERAPDRRAVVDAMIQAGRGLVAAHAAGLVHRDIKPDNLLIGEDGRVRVADFGLARHDVVSSERVTDTGGAVDTVAGPGTAVGTPMYMPPEQHDGGAIGPYTDQFSFCVTLWEGLYGQRPFVGETREVSAGVRAGAPPPPDGAPPLPAWLEQALRRGLSARPTDRWPSMQALLDVLSVDEAARRARRRGRALYAALITVGCVALVLGARALHAAWSRARVERAAAERLVGVAANVEQMLADGLREEAEVTLRGFVEEPELRGTGAAIDAWLTWADLMDARDDRAAVQAAVVEAYAALPADDPREPAIALRIARQFDRAWKYDELAALGERVLARWPAVGRSEAWLGLRSDAALARGDFAGFLAVQAEAGADERAPLVRALATATCPLHGDYLALPTDWPGGEGREVVVYEHGYLEGQSRRTTLRRMDPALTPVGPAVDPMLLWSESTHARPLVLEPGGPAIFVDYAPAPVKEQVLIELGVDGPRERLRWPDDTSQSAEVVDLDGDGRRELYVGTGTYTRKLYRLDRDADGTWRRRPAHPPTDAVGSDINGLVAGDFDGDGRPELAAAVGAWRAYDVRIFEAGPDGTMRIAARRRLGHVRQIAALRAADGSTVLALAKDDTALSKEAWAPGEPQGEPAGVHIVRRRGADLVAVAHVPWPDPVARTRPFESFRLLPGDFDGDGLEDLAVALESGSPFVTAMLLRQRPDGSFVHMLIGGFAPLVAGEFDGDPGVELLAALRRGGATGLCVLGVAGGEPVAVGPASHEAAATPALTDPLLARVWARAEDLAGFGLYSDAARALERRVSLADSDADRRALQRRIAGLEEAAGDYGAAGEHLAALASAGDAAAALQAVADFEHDLRTGDALRVARAALRDGGLSPTQSSALAAAVQRLAGVEDRVARVEQRFDGPLDPRWRIVEPLALRADPVHGAMLVDAGADMGVLAELPIELTGEPLTFELDLDLARTDWGTRLALAVIAVDSDELVAELGVSGGGGGGYLRRTESFHPFWTSHSREIAGPAEPSRHRLRATLLPGQGRTHVVHAHGDPEEIRVATDRPIRPGPHRLVLRSVGVPGFESQLLRARVLRVALLGARAAGGPAPRGPARALVEARWADVIADAEPSAERPLWHAVAAAELGRIAPAVAALAALDPDDPAVRRHLRQLLRTRAATFAPVLRAALGGRYPSVLLAALRKQGEYPDDELAALRLALTADLDGFPEASGADELATRAGLQALRGAARLATGALALAEADLAAAIATLAARKAITGEVRDPELAALALRLAEVAARQGRVDVALAAAGQALADAADPAWMIERIRISPALAPLRADARGQDMLAEPR